MKCPVCEKGETMQETRDLPYTYKGQETVFKAISGAWCNECGEVFLRPGEIDKYMKVMGAFKKQVNSKESILRLIGGE